MCTIFLYARRSLTSTQPRKPTSNVVPREGQPQGWSVIRPVDSSNTTPIVYNLEPRAKKTCGYHREAAMAHIGTAIEGRRTCTEAQYAPVCCWRTTDQLTIARTTRSRLNRSSSMHQKAALQRRILGLSICCPS
jgi:hypothetical protein